MKKTLFAASLLVAGIAFADSTTVETSYTLGVLPVAMAKDQADIILGIPWIEAGQSLAEGVAVTNLVKTANLNSGDMLYWYDTNSGDYKMWILRGTYWESVQTNPSGEISGKDIEGNDTTYSVKADETVLDRGEALVLKRNSNLDATTIYVIGQYKGGTTEEITIANSKKTLIASPLTSDTDLNAATWANVDDKDEIIVRAGDNGLLKHFYYCEDPSDSKKKWATLTYNPSTLAYGTNYTAVVSAGEGAWYNSKKTSGTETKVSWTISE